jgi:hypothetical protein
MPDFEHRLLKRWGAATLARAGLVMMTVGALPILLYSWFGPADGNPIGLGLLMVALVPAGFLLFGIGLLKWLLAKVLSQH